MQSHVVDPAAVRRFCDERGMSLRDLEAASGLSYSFVKYVATPRRKGVGAQRNCLDTSIRLLAGALGVTVSDITIPVKRTEGHSHAAA